MRIGFFLSSEEFGPRELVRQARMAEGAGFHGLWISDHFHPWNEEQGHSSFVWSVIGAISQAISRVKLWPTEQLPGELAQILPTPAHFEQAVELVSEDMVAEAALGAG
jgi:hypothetical protein